VIYTGHESKIMLNSKAAPSKVSNVLLKMNKMLYTVFLFQLVICIVFASATMVWLTDNADDHVYLDKNSDPSGLDWFI
jgi:phospholipid-transporting ATPase